MSLGFIMVDIVRYLEMIFRCGKIILTQLNLAYIFQRRVCILALNISVFVFSEFCWTWQRIMRKLLANLCNSCHDSSSQEFIWLVHDLFPQVMFYTLAVVTFGTAVPAGQFVPGIMIGSTYGRLVGMFVVRVYKKPNIDEGTWVLFFFLVYFFNSDLVMRYWNIYILLFFLGKL